MPDSGNTSYVGYIITLLGTLGTALGLTMKIKGAQDEKIKGIDKGLKDHKKDVNAKFDAQGKRIDSRVHRNDFDNLEDTMNREFGHVRETFSTFIATLDRIESNTNRKRASDKNET